MQNSEFIYFHLKSFIELFGTKNPCVPHSNSGHIRWNSPSKIGLSCLILISAAIIPVGITMGADEIKLTGISGHSLTIFFDISRNMNDTSK